LEKKKFQNYFSHFLEKKLFGDFFYFPRASLIEGIIFLVFIQNQEIEFFSENLFLEENIGKFFVDKKVTKCQKKN